MTHLPSPLQLWRDFQTCRRYANQRVPVQHDGVYSYLKESPLLSPYGRAASRLPRWLLRLANATAIPPKL